MLISHHKTGTRNSQIKTLLFRLRQKSLSPDAIAAFEREIEKRVRTAGVIAVYAWTDAWQIVIDTAAATDERVRLQLVGYAKANVHDVEKNGFCVVYVVDEAYAPEHKSAFYRELAAAMAA